MKHILILFFLSVAAMANTQAQTFDQRMTITDAGELYSTFNLHDSQVRGELKRIFGTGYNEMIKRSDEDGWPTGLMTLDSRSVRKKEIESFAAYKVLEFGEYIVLKIPAAENKNQPADVKADYDFYMVFNREGVEAYSGFSAPSASQTGTPVKLLGTGGLYSTYDLATDENNTNIRRQVGSEYAKMIAYSKEDSWPSGISTMSARDQVRNDMLKYKAWKIAEFDGKYIIRIPASENTFMPLLLRPKQDIYFIIQEKDVKLLQ